MNKTNISRRVLPTNDLDDDNLVISDDLLCDMFSPNKFIFIDVNESTVNRLTIC